MPRKRFDPIIVVNNDGLKLPDPVGAWSEKKYELVGGYCDIFNDGIKNKFKNRVYIDLFAGAGFAPIKGKNKILKTSALIALSIPNPFTKYIFCEMDQEKIDTLEKRARKEFPDTDMTFICGDSNKTVELVINEVKKLGLSTISFCFVDPFSLNLHFETIEKLSQLGRIDFLILLALMMNAKRNLHNFIEEESKTIDLYIKKSDWREPFLKGEARKEDFIKFLADTYDQNMKSLGYLVKNEGLKPKVDADEFNLSLYYLAFYSKHNLGNKFFADIQKYRLPQQKLF
ncbi:MAG TPA: three-Cys-motif partner protein TcmP [Ferruginibacter sp.]|jgi:three-Cys-motif partner protein|nr:three-Cys-motif partner protein TcmP [Ferruginibacter sp.]